MGGLTAVYIDQTIRAACLCGTNGRSHYIHDRSLFCRGWHALNALLRRSDSILTGTWLLSLCLQTSSSWVISGVSCSRRTIVCRCTDNTASPSHSPLLSSPPVLEVSALVRVPTEVSVTGLCCSLPSCDEGMQTKKVHEREYEAAGFTRTTVTRFTTDQPTYHRPTVVPSSFVLYFQV